MGLQEYELGFFALEFEAPILNEVSYALGFMKASSWSLLINLRATKISTLPAFAFSTFLKGFEDAFAVL